MSRHPKVIVHGGAGNWPSRKQQSALRGVRQASTVGYQSLQRDGSALDAVENAIISLEDDPTFNAGTGSAINLLGKIENDASIMNGRTLESGSIALVSDIRNPITLARLIMEETDHVLMAGHVASAIGRAHGLKTGTTYTRERRADWKRERQKLLKGRNRDFRKNSRILRSGLLDQPSDTVGALALDRDGMLAAGCSTGGLTLKLPGRIGDSALVGAGLYADDKVGAATCTGVGEFAIRLVLAKVACDYMRSRTAQISASKTIRLAVDRVGMGLGLITLDRKGGYGVAHSTRNICWSVTDENGTRGAMQGGRFRGP